MKWLSKLVNKFKSKFKKGKEAEADVLLDNYQKAKTPAERRKSVAGLAALQEKPQSVEELEKTLNDCFPGLGPLTEPKKT